MLKKIWKKKEPNYWSLSIWGYCLLISLIFLQIASKSSPLYPFNDWVDVNASFTMGKAMMNGRILYRDIFDQRGPLFYLLFGLAYLISSSSFLGVFILEVFSFSVFLYFCFKLFSLFLDNKYSLIALSLIALFILNLISFEQGGSSEEFCLPLIAISLYCLLNYFKNVYPKPMPYQGIFINGIIAGSVLWMKYSLLGFWVGWIVSILLCVFINMGFLHVVKNSLVFSLGIITTTIPWIIYFGVNLSIVEFINSYFLINMIYYPQANSINSIVRFTMIGIISPFLLNPVFVTHLYSGLIIFIIHKKYLNNTLKKIGLFLCFFLLILSVHGSGRGYLYRYYFLIISPFVIFGFIVLFTIIYERFGKIKSFNLFSMIIVSIVVVGFLYTLRFNQNTSMMKVDEEDLVQYNFATIINQTEDATLLNYGRLDGGFYTTTGITPNVKFFQNQNIPHSKFPLVMDEQNRYIKEQVVDYVIIQIQPSQIDDFSSIPYLEENYKLIKEEHQQYENEKFYYLLFKKTED